MLPLQEAPVFDADRNACQIVPSGRQLSVWCMIGENRLVRVFGKNRKSPGDVLQQYAHSFLATKRREQAIMVRTKPKREKPEETIEEFVARVNKPSGKRNGLKRQVKGARR